MHKDQLHDGILPLLYAQLQIDKLWLVHRLDKLTSGCLILARNSQAAAVFGELFAQRQIDKYYLAITAKKPTKKQGTVSGEMKKSRAGKWILTTSQTNPAISQFFSQGLFDGKRLIIIKPRTGKTHQIRVMLKSLGAPILGDTLYGGQDSDRTYLHAYALAFMYQGQRIELSCQPQQGEHYIRMAQQQLLAPFDQPQLLVWPKIKTSHNAEQHHG